MMMTELALQLGLVSKQFVAGQGKQEGLLVDGAIDGIRLSIVDKC